MTSKEIVLNEIKRLEHNLKIYEKENMTTQIEYAKTNIIVNNLILKDLEVLDQLKEILSMDYLVRVYGYDTAKRLQTYLKSNEVVKNWLEKRDK